jgi:hypothetical protein
VDAYLPQDRQIVAELALGPVGEPAYDEYCRTRKSQLRDKARRQREAYRIGREHWESR